MYAIAQYVPKCNQETIAAKKVDDTGLSRRATSTHPVDLSAISIARRTPEQNQSRIQGQPATGPDSCRATNEATIGGHRSPNPKPNRQHAVFVTRNPEGRRGRDRKIFCRRKAFAS